MEKCDFALLYNIKSHWDQFEVILLEENHRTGEEKFFADLLNRIRVNEQTDSDIEYLQEKVRPKGHADLKDGI